MPADDLPVAEFAFPGTLRGQLVAAILAGEKTTTTGLVADYEPSYILSGKVKGALEWLIWAPRVTLVPDGSRAPIRSRTGPGRCGITFRS